MVEILRDTHGRWLPGQKSPNPHGAPKGPRLSTQVREALQAIALKKENGEERTYADLLVERILNLAIVQGNTTMIALIWAYVDGRPVARTSFVDDQESDRPELNPRVRELADKLRDIQRGHLR